MTGCGRKIGPTHYRMLPLTLAQANKLVLRWHRHHKPVIGYRFALGVALADELIGAAIVGRPVAAECDHYSTAEITRLVTNGHKNACSFLYAACARVAKEMGFWKIQTYILEDEPGTSLRAAGWQLEARTAGGNWNHSWRKGRREDQPLCRKQRWAKILNPDYCKIAEERIALVEAQPNLFEKKAEQMELSR